jgi:hypothetical protein
MLLISIILGIMWRRSRKEPFEITAVSSTRYPAP